METAGAEILVGVVHDQESSVDVSGLSSAQADMATVEQLSRVKTGEQHYLAFLPGDDDIPCQVINGDVMTG